MEHRSFDITNKGKKAIQDLYIKYPEIEEIEECVKFYDKDLTPDELSRCAVQMSILLIRIGGLVAELQSLANEAYIYRKFKYLWSYTSLKKDIKVKDKENIALEDTFEHYEAELLNRFIADFFKTQYESWSRLIMNIQSRLNVLKSERINANQQV
jgi:hypothetical protein